MAEAITVQCPEGHPVTTTVRGKGTHCRKCGRTVYVRTDGTVKATPASSAAAGPQDAPLPPDDAPGRVLRDREMWEIRVLDSTDLGDVAAEYGVTTATVRNAVKREAQRQADWAAMQTTQTRTGADRLGDPPGNRG